MQHCSLTTPNIVENYMLCLLAHPVACSLLHVVGTYTVQKPVKLLAPCKWTQHCWLITPNIVGSCYIPLHIALSVNCGVTKAYTQLCSGELCTLRQKESYRESDSFALNQKDILVFLKSLFGTKRTVSVKFDTILLIL